MWIISLNICQCDVDNRVGIKNFCTNRSEICVQLKNFPLKILFGIFG